MSSFTSCGAVQEVLQGVDAELFMAIRSCGVLVDIPRSTPKLAPQCIVALLMLIFGAEKGKLGE
jgi:hypothetical protein